MVIGDVTIGADVDGMVVGGGGVDGVDGVVGGGGVVVTTPGTKCRDVIRKLECRQVYGFLFTKYKVCSKLTL